MLSKSKAQRLLQRKIECRGAVLPDDVRDIKIIAVLPDDVWDVKIIAHFWRLLLKIFWHMLVDLFVGSINTEFVKMFLPLRAYTLSINQCSKPPFQFVWLLHLIVQLFINFRSFVVTDQDMCCCPFFISVVSSLPYVRERMKFLLGAG